MRNLNYCHIYYNSPTHPLLPLSLAIYKSPENCDWTLSHKPAQICSHPLLLLFCCFYMMETIQPESGVLNTLKSLSLSPLDSSRYVDGGPGWGWLWAVVFVGTRILPTTMRRSTVRECSGIMFVFIQSQYMSIMCQCGYSMSDVCACIYKSQYG